MRDRWFNINVGFPGHGKSTLAEQLINKSRSPNALLYLEEEDLYDDAWAGFKLRDLYRYNGGKAKINAELHAYPEFLQVVRTGFRNGTLVIDEGGLHEQHTLSRELKAILAKRRKIGVDVIINYHGLSDLPVKQFQFLNNLILFHTTDEFAQKGNVPRIKDILAARDRIAARVAKGDKYYHEVIRLA